MNKTIIVILVATPILAGLIWVAQPNIQSAETVALSSNGELIVEDSSNHDFGTISMRNGDVKHQFKIKNASSEAVAINKMYTSCMCTTATLLIRAEEFGPYGMPGHGAIPKINQVVNPGEAVIVEVVFDPKAHGPAGVGRIERAVTLENNTGTPLELRFLAMVTP